jgi:hypothetical protein
MMAIVVASNADDMRIQKRCAVERLFIGKSAAV